MRDKQAILVMGANDATGGAIAKRFAKEGYIACVTRHSVDKLQTLVHELASAVPRCLDDGAAALDGNLLRPGRANRRFPAALPLPLHWRRSVRHRMESAAPTGRSAGSLAWAGLANTYFWIDATLNIAGLAMMQALPFMNQRTVDVFYDFEKSVYASLS